MIITARKLEELYRASGAAGQVVLPYRARLTPLAVDWVKSKRVTLGYSELSAAKPADIENKTDGCACPSTAAPKPAGDCGCGCSHGSKAGYLWWCDGPCGPAKAVLTLHEKESGLKPLDVQPGAKQIVTVVKKLAAEVKEGHAAGGVLMVQSGAAAMIYANRCPSLRSVLGTCRDAVEQGVQLVAANVLVIEYPHKTLQEMKNMVARFVSARREPSEEVKRQLQELASCS